MTENNTVEELKPTEVAALPSQAPQEPPKPTHATIPVDAFNEIVKRLGKISWEESDPIIQILKQVTSYATINQNIKS